MIYNKKAEFGLQKFMIAMLLFSAVFALFYIYVADMSTTYEDYANPIIDPAFDDSFNKFGDTKSDISGMYAEMRGEEGFTFLGGAQIILRSFLGVIQFGYSSIADLSTLLANFGSTYGIPAEISEIILNVVFGGIAVTIVILIINAIATRGSGKL